MEHMQLDTMMPEIQSFHPSQRTGRDAGTGTDDVILLVNDSIMGKSPLSEIIRSAGYIISVSLVGENALIKLRQESYELVIFDLSSSALTALEVLYQFKLVLPDHRFHILFLTPAGEEAHTMHGINQKRIDFLSWPFSREELFVRINSRLEIIRMSKEVQLKKHLLDSINSARRIQRSLLPDKNSLARVFKEHFILELPLNVISGDFIWVRKVRQTLFFALADCTGHGVPGALLSVLGISLLNEIYFYESPAAPHVLLNRLEEKLGQSLIAENVNKSEIGMDIVAGMIDLESDILSVSGAFHSLYIRRGEQIIELKGDKQSIGPAPFQRPFQSQSIQLEKDDIIYASSDGYMDQFGGKLGKRLQKRTFTKFLKETGRNPIKNQEKILMDKFMKWKGCNDQVDDVLVLGFKI